MVIFINPENSNNSEFCINSNNIEWIRKYDIPFLEVGNDKYRIDIKTISEKFTVTYNNREKRNEKYNEIISKL